MTGPTSPARVLSLVSPITGIVVALEEVPDRTFAERLAGDGVAVEPLGNTVVAPCDARVAHVHRANHAIVLETLGLEILIHVGVDTVKLGGEGFRRRVGPGDLVRQGDPLLEFDADLVAQRAPSLLTTLLITNPERVASLDYSRGTVTAGRDVLLRVTLAEEGAAVATSTDTVAVVRSAPMIVRASGGLHARPAAQLVKVAHGFKAELRLVRGADEANLRSVVSIMALEVAEGDTVSVLARGEDSAAAIAALGAILEAAHGGSMRVSDTVERAAAPLARHAGKEGHFAGIPAAPGLAVGELVRLAYQEPSLVARASDPEHELHELNAAIAAARRQLDALCRRTSDDSAQTGIFAAHLELLDDPELVDRASSDIRGGAAAGFAWRAAYTAQAERLSALRSPLLAGRAADVRDVGRRVLHLLVRREGAVVALPDAAIVLAEELTPSDAAALDVTKVRGVCTTTGSSTSHAAIIARGLGLPAVCGLDPRVLSLAAGTRVVLDGDAGTLRANPTAEEEREVGARLAELSRRRSDEKATVTLRAETRDGRRVEVGANVGSPRDAEQVTEQGGEGVGLVRSEFLFMDRDRAPDEEEQLDAYGAILRAVGADKLVVIRTLDVGGDKPLRYHPMAPEENPFLGERGVRFTLARPELFRTQIRAILRASRHGRVAMMFPMIATLAEWREASAMVEEERRALGVAPIQVGIMVETAAAALLAAPFAREASFLSIGTNDLTQYTLAMDRGNARLASQLDPLHPAVLQLIARTVAGGHEHDRWVGVCGALAGDPAAVPVLVGLGVDELSTDLPLIPAVKARVRELSFEECQATARLALDASDAGEVRALVARRHARPDGMRTDESIPSGGRSR